MSNLILHCGAHGATRNDIDAVATPAPTGSHVAVPHAHLLDLVHNHIETAGFTIAAEAYGLHTKGDILGANFFALIELEQGGDGHSLTIGLRNSHSQQFAASIAIGSRVFVCDNLAFSGEVKIARKHTQHILRDLPQCVAAAVGRINQVRVAQDERIAAYKATTLAVRDSDHLLIELLRARAVPASHIGQVLREYEAPRHEEHLGEQGERTLWTLFNAVTEASTKGTNVFDLSRKTQALHGVCDAAAGIIGTVAKTAQEIATDAGVEDADFEEVRIAA
jgi:hypothetical protein